MRRLRKAQQRHAREHRKFKRRAIAASTAAVISLGAGFSLNKAFAEYTPDKHQLPVSQDADADLLSNKEEIAIGYQLFTPDQNRNGILDGVELATCCASMINKLYTYIPGTMMPIPNRTYKVKHALFGVEQCDICGQEIHMGGWEIINPKLNLNYPDPNDPLDGAFLPDLALHYMEHGSFDCYGTDHKGRVDATRLLRVLEIRYPYEPNEHQLPVKGNEHDGDLLTDSEELAAGYNLYDADQNENLVPDGIELSKQCAEVIEALPIFDPDGPELNAVYKVDFSQRGLEWCEVCGESVNMGYCQITNFKLGLSIDVPYIVSHYMRHGSFSYSGNVHGKGRFEVALLIKILEMPRRCGDLGTVYHPGDLNKDCKVDIEDLTEFLEIWLEGQTPRENRRQTTEDRTILTSDF